MEHELLVGGKLVELEISGMPVLQVTANFPEDIFLGVDELREGLHDFPGQGFDGKVLRLIEDAWKERKKRVYEFVGELEINVRAHAQASRKLE